MAEAVLVSAALSVGTGILGAVGANQAASAEAKAAELERMQLESERNLSELQAVQEEQTRREELRRQLSANLARAGGSGLATTGRGFLNTQEQTRKLAERDIVNVRTFGTAQSNRLAIGASAAKSRKKAAITQGGFGSAGSLLGGFGGATDTVVSGRSLLFGD